MISLGEMKNIIIDTLYDYSAYELPNICSSIGLEDGTCYEAFNSKRRYVSSRINSLNKEEIISVLHQMKERLDICLIPEEKYSYSISEVTKRDISDLLINGLDMTDSFQTSRVKILWHGRISELDFIKRVCDTSKIQVDDNRCNNFDEEFVRHREFNSDYAEDYFFTLDKLPYKNSDSDTFLKILCEMFHPAVRDENGYWKEFKEKISTLIKEDGFEFYVIDHISGREVYGYRKITFLDSNQTLNIDNLKKVSEEINSDYIYKQISIMEQNQKDNPTEAIGKAKELLETICKTILSRLEKEIDESWEIQTLTAKTYKALKLSPDDVKEGPLSQTVKQILGGLNSVSSGIASLRNSYGSGHGKVDSFKSLPERYAKLAIGSVSTLVVFLWETMLYQIEKSN